jgi:hypothetical protein
MAITLVYTPLWFHGIDIFLEVFSALAAVMISIVGYKAYKLTCDKKYMYFSTAFVFITLSFIARALTIGTVLLQFTNGGSTMGAGGPSFNLLEAIFGTGRFFYFLLVLFAFLILLALSMKIERKSVLFLLNIFMILFAATAFSSSPMIFYLASLVLLIFISAQYIANYKKKQTRATLLTAIAFSFMAFEFVMFISGVFYRPLVIGAYASRLISYAILLWMMIKVYFRK